MVSELFNDVRTHASANQHRLQVLEDSVKGIDEMLKDFKTKMRNHMRRSWLEMEEAYRQSETRLELRFRNLAARMESRFDIMAEKLLQAQREEVSRLESSIEASMEEAFPEVVEVTINWKMFAEGWSSLKGTDVVMKPEKSSPSSDFAEIAEIANLAESAEREEIANFSETTDHVEAAKAAEAADKSSLTEIADRVEDPKVAAAKVANTSGSAEAAASVTVSEAVDFTGVAGIAGQAILAMVPYAAVFIEDVKAKMKAGGRSLDVFRKVKCFWTMDSDGTGGKMIGCNGEYDSLSGLQRFN